MEPHPLITQLKFTRSEFLTGIKNVSDEDGSKRLLPMNCISWNVGHLAWQEQRYFLHFGQGLMPFPDVQKMFAYGAPASTPPLSEMLAIWRKITKMADPWLENLNSARLMETVKSNGKPIDRTIGNLLQRTIYHYWYHNGENQAIRQQLGHKKLPVFVGNIDDKAPYHPESPI
ncbi:DinB family protein, partial [bacterium]|nr:DinB family protein [bacterium]